MWSNDQKSLAARACSAAGISEANRKTILSGPVFANRAVHQGRVTSTSPRLTNSDFEIFMEFIERHAGGQVKIGGHNGLGFDPGHFAIKAANAWSRTQCYADRIARKLEDSGVLHLGPGRERVGLHGWIKYRVCGGQDKIIAEMDWPELHALINGLRGLARQHGISLEEPACAS